MSENKEKQGYDKGYVEALKDFGTACTSTNCISCPIATLKGTELTCMEFMRKFPSKFASMLQFMTNKEQTYLTEYRLRFPDCVLTDDEIPNEICRKLIFEGNNECQGGDCKACWSEAYEGMDSESIDETEEDDE
jgi:hypothetical protein